ncbi:SacI homology domain-containing protein [Thamnocephalis sphaerospora]|uniref:SacI homology domain-containing protein n=1 Tax=Thamnocephalis sphaerospora TaxID=78915 RepID=A0A4P9XTM8_9FUNG|nr:SacI homology domain-containing protein [Thamnocephalis sphaerospora]|eukprot:RKP09538.1 SacI homology domain-containing protein [Thamnocephalis sphaerospora]
MEKMLTCHGILGTMSLLSGNYLIAITGRSRIGSIDGHDIYGISDTQIFRYARSDAHLSAQQKADEARYLSLLRSALGAEGYYFSYTYDLAQSQQRQAGLGSLISRPLWERAEDRFFWNRFLQKSLIELAQQLPGVGEYIMPVIFGFLEIRAMDINGASFDFALISRRNRNRMGTRFFSRGVDAQGNVANQVETEQIVVVHDVTGNGERRRMSFVQTRGSIPVYWGQVCTLKYTPKLYLDVSQDAVSAARKHFDDQLALYGPQIIVNLVNKHGYEKPMADAFRSVMANLNDDRIRYIHFDFHRECSGMRWDRISLLLTSIKQDLERQGYFEQVLRNDGSAEVTHSQTSVVRTNCMDCLDRTNVVQSAIARDVLVRQLRSTGIFGITDTVQSYPVFEDAFRNIWADNANAVSVAYSGTGALKTDFTRTGKRSKAGMVQDLVNSIVRYVKNNYMDGLRQDAYDLLLGTYVIQADGPSPLAMLKPQAARAIPAAALLSLVMLFLGFTFPGTENVGWFAFMFWCTMWSGLLGAAAHVALQRSDELVDWPRLVSYPYRDMAHSVKGARTRTTMATGPGLKTETIIMQPASDRKAD